VGQAGKTATVGILFGFGSGRRITIWHKNFTMGFCTFIVL
jgi:uncharacterized membrane protein (UPF0127 family)